ncbi:MAG: hypothetical protein ACLR8Y_02405 [Alistipes indistinctus]
MDYLEQAPEWMFAVTVTGHSRLGKLLCRLRRRIGGSQR